MAEQVWWREERAGLAYKRVLTLVPSGMITYAALPASARLGDNLVLWYDYKNTGTETANFRPCMNAIGLGEVCFSAKTLEPGQSISDIFGRPTFLSFLDWWDYPVTRVDLRVEVETPEGWVEIDKRTGPPFKASDTHLLPELLKITAPTYAAPDTEVTVEITGVNKGYTNAPAIIYYKNEILIGYVGFPIIGQNTVFKNVFMMPSNDVTMMIQVGRNSADGYLINPNYKTVKIIAGEAPPVEALLPAIGSIVTGIVLIAAALHMPGR